MTKADQLKEFEWKNYEVIFRKKDFNKIESNKRTSAYVVIISNIMVSVILGVSLLIRLLRYCLRMKNVRVYGLKFNYINDLIILYSISFLLMSLITNILVKTLFSYRKLQKYCQYSSVIEIFSLELWVLFLYFSIPVLISRKDFIYYESLLEYLSNSLLVGPIFIISAFSIKRFECYYIERFLRSNHVEQTENILFHIKNFYETGISSSSTVSNISDYFIDFQTIEKLDNLKIQNDSKSEMLLREPVFKSAKEATKVSNKVFMMLSGAKEKPIDYNTFSQIFSDAESTISAFSYFDTRKDRMITYRGFKDTVLYLYQLRFFLTKTLKSKKQFIALISKLFYLLIISIILLFHLLLSGVALTRIFTFLFSTGFTIQLFGSRLIDVFIKSILLILSHPYDIGDEIVLDDVEHKVYKIGLFNTSFLNATGGIINMTNSSLYNKSIINITRAPENKLMFEIILATNVDLDQIKSLEERIVAYLEKHEFDFLNTYELINKVSHDIKIKDLTAMIILQSRGYKNRAKKFLLRIEFLHFLNKTLKELELHNTS